MTDDAMPTVLFLCVHNAGRSQMALGWFNQLASGRAIAWSGGSEPGAEINPTAVEATDRLGGSLAGALIGAEAGMDAVRVHDVRETVQALSVWAAVRVRPPAGQ